MKTPIDWFNCLKPGDRVRSEGPAGRRAGVVVGRTPSGMIDVHFPDQLEPERFRGGRSQVNRAPGARDYLLPALWSGETQKRRKLAVKAFREASTSARIAYVTTERIEQATAVLKGETPE